MEPLRASTILLRTFPLFGSSQRKAESRKEMLDAEDCSISDIVQNCQCTVIIKTGAIFSKVYYFFQFSADDMPPLLPVQGQPTLPNPPTICHCLFNTRRGQDLNIMSQDYLNKQVYIFCIIQENPREPHTTKGPSMGNKSMEFCNI